MLSEGIKKTRDTLQNLSEKLSYLKNKFRIKIKYFKNKLNVVKKTADFRPANQNIETI